MQCPLVNYLLSYHCTRSASSIWWYITFLTKVHSWLHPPYPLSLKRGEVQSSDSLERKTCLSGGRFLSLPSNSLATNVGFDTTSSSWRGTGPHVQDYHKSTPQCNNIHCECALQTTTDFSTVQSRTDVLCFVPHKPFLAEV